MKNINEKEFIEFANDHIKHFDAVPMEFEDSKEVIIGPEKCWELAVKLGLTKKLSWKQ